jgi:transposase
LSPERRIGNFAEVAQNASDAPPPELEAAGCRRSAALQEGDVRVTTAFKRLLRLPGASVIDVSFTGEGVVVTVRLRRRRRVCAVCGQTGRRLEIHDRRIKRWRNLDLGASRCVIECELRLLRCRDCGVRMEPVPWARPGAAHTRDFEDVVAWLAQQMARTAICGLLRVGWDTVGRIVTRVVADRLDERRCRAWSASASTRSATAATTAI